MDQKAKENTPEAYWKQCLEWAAEKDYSFRQCCNMVNVKPDGLSLAQIDRLPLQVSVEAASVFSRLNLPASSISRFLGTTPYLILHSRKHLTRYCNKISQNCCKH